MTESGRGRGTGTLMIGLILMLGCRQDMHDQPRYEPFERSDFFADGLASRPPVPDTVARGQLHGDPAMDHGRGPDGGDIASSPVPMSAALLARGRERYEIYCAPCHDRVGNGRGMVVRRGFKEPPTFHDDRLRSVPDGHLFDVITNGFGAMSSYAAVLSPQDRWAVVAYVRALQLSQHAMAADLPPGARARLEDAP